MRTLTPSHAKRVQLYRDPTPLLHRYQVESQLDAIHNPVVQLKSGGYIVINSTEALVAIDRSEEHTSELQSLMRSSYAVFCLKKKKNKFTNNEQSYNKLL